MVNYLDWLIYYNHKIILENIPEKLRISLREHREMAFLSKKLATIDTNTPIEFALENHEFLSKNLRNENTIALFKAWEFRSLLDEKDQEVYANFDSLAITQESITTQETLEKLQEEIRHTPRISLSVMIEKNTLQGIVIGFENHHFVVIQNRYVKLDSFVDFLLQYPGEIIGYDLKKDYKALLQFQKNSRNFLPEEILTIF